MANIDTPPTCRTCGKQLPPQQGKGRVRQYCDATCRSAARRHRVKPTLTDDDRKGYVDGELAAVAAAQDRARDAEEALRQAVEQARTAGHTWQELGDVLGTSRQAAFQRFGRPVDPRTGEQPARDLLPGATERAVELLADLVANRWTAVRKDFDEQMAAGLPVDKIVEVWAQVLGMIGAFERMGEPVALRVGACAVVNVPLYCEAGELTGRVAFNADGTVGGLFFLPA